METWIGYTDAPKEGVWLSADGSPFCFNKWKGGEPNGSSGEHYAEMDRVGWNDAGLGSKRSVACSKILNETSEQQVARERRTKVLQALVNAGVEATRAAQCDFDRSKFPLTVARGDSKVVKLFSDVFNSAAEYRA